MNEYLKNKFKDKEKEIKYLRQNSYWYKILNRDPLSFDKMQSEMKEKLGLRFTDKLDNVNNIIELLSLLNENDE